MNQSDWKMSSEMVIYPSTCQFVPIIWLLLVNGMRYLTHKKVLLIPEAFGKNPKIFSMWWSEIFWWLFINEFRRDVYWPCSNDFHLIVNYSNKRQRQLLLVTVVIIINFLCCAVVQTPISDRPNGILCTECWWHSCAFVWTDAHAFAVCRKCDLPLSRIKSIRAWYVIINRTHPRQQSLGW